jgi:hypothetical protein
MDTETTTSVWEFLELPNTHARQAQACYEWGLNCDRNGNPFLVFLDLIGWSTEHYGEHLVMGSFGSLGYMELSYLADALNEYALFPNEVTEWVTALMMCEGV